MYSGVARAGQHPDSWPSPVSQQATQAEPLVARRGVAVDRFARPGVRHRSDHGAEGDRAAQEGRPGCDVADGDVSCAKLTPDIKRDDVRAILTPSFASDVLLSSLRLLDVQAP